MMRLLKTRLTMLLILTLVLSCTMPAFAVTDNTLGMPSGSAVHEIRLSNDQVKEMLDIKVIDKATGQELKRTSSNPSMVMTDKITDNDDMAADIKVNSVRKVYDENTDLYTLGADVTVTLADPTDGRDTTDGIRITAYMQYRKGGTSTAPTISMRKVYGKYYNIGLYYYTDPHVYWANSVDYNHSSRVPTSASWSYTPDTAFVAYYTSVPPYVESDATCNIAGMSGGEYEVPCLFRLLF